MSVQVSFSPEVPSTALVVRLVESGEEVPEVPPSAREDAERGPVLTYVGAQRTALVSVSSDGDRLEALRSAAASGAEVARRVEASDAAFVWNAGGQEAACALVEGFVLGAYRFAGYRRETAPAVERLTLVGDDAARHEDAVARAAAVADAACLARDLVNLSPHEKTAPMLADRIRDAATSVGLRCEVWEHERIEAEGMGGLLAVNRGSVEPPRFVVLEHAPGGTAEQQPGVLVGKAIVFDTGGLSLKSTKDSMDKMKSDMAGGAVVAATMVALARIGFDRRVVALIPMTDNRPGGHAYVPGEVVKMRSGLHVEVLNTDAEGRMILADALDYARQLSPRLVVDLATLTGSAVMALGERTAALMTPSGDDAARLTQQFSEAGRRTGEYVHPLPMDPFYAESLKSDIADLKNVGGREGGAITAAKFLERFAQDEAGEPAYPWVHLDIAGPSFISSPQPYRPKGGTGFGVRLLVEFLSSAP